MKIMVFLHGTAIMHKSGIGKKRDERVQQVKRKEKSVYDYAHYVPVGNAVEKLKSWQIQGATMLYLSSHKTLSNVKKDEKVLQTYNFPSGDVFYRKRHEAYHEVVERVIPDILIESYCQELCIEGSRGVFFYPESILEGHALHDLWQVMGGP
jgi:hypothetical protein